MRPKGLLALGTGSFLFSFDYLNELLIWLKGDCLVFQRAIVASNLQDVSVDFIDRIALEALVALLAELLDFDVEVVDVLSNQADLLSLPRQLFEDIVKS
jgi:hypothetical protein